MTGEIKQDDPHNYDEVWLHGWELFVLVEAGRMVFLLELIPALVNIELEDKIDQDGGLPD